ncbi:hypothetical protein DGMP_10400 [Desulfomarina profundi]|uniref:Schlafen AlbA-2 domain-containing protein n=2 Tax=Desulfomarina profundi TaxID=2772557 RepID=A0A8D5FUY0_9BACT|nr:hypothetical protein DGMP_10400 [Desulfomarina profundi]
MLNMTKISLMKKIFLLATSFIFFLAGINIYQYLKIKTEIAPTLISEISNVELGEIRVFFASITEQLNIVREWGANGALHYENIHDLNKLFFPLLENKTIINSLVLANSMGDEYFLYKDGQRTITRYSHDLKSTPRTLHFAEWQTVDKELKTWKKTDDYDPRQMSWFFTPDKKNRIHITPVRTFIYSKEKGVTTSVSWKHNGSQVYSVFGLNIPLANIEKFLSIRNKKYSGIVFLINSSENTYISSNSDEISQKNELLDILIHKWNDSGQPRNQVVQFLKGKQPWLASLQPLNTDHPNFWLGVAAPEKQFMSQINAKLFQIDFFDLLIALAGTGLVYLLFMKTHQRKKKNKTPIVRLNEAINRGEGPEIEFKSTVRFNLKTDKNGKEIELAWLKTVVAFLNTRGGTLLIGVNDNGELTGLEKDNFENRDKCLLHVKNLINHHIGAEFSRFIETTLVEIEDKEALLIECSPASTPIFLHIGKNEEFYVRSGPSSAKLTPSQTVRYVTQDHTIDLSGD